MSSNRPALKFFDRPALKFFDAETIHKALDDLKALILEMQIALGKFSSGQVTQPVRTVVSVDAHQGFLGLMPAHVKQSGSSDQESLGVKLVSFYPFVPNPPTHHAIIALFNPETGAPEAIMDGSVITEYRTAAVSAVAAKLLSNPSSSVICILGSGAQAFSHWELMKHVRSFTSLRIWSRTKSNAEALAAKIIAHEQLKLEEGKKLGRAVNQVDIQAFDTVDAATEGADVIVCATAATEPVLFGKHVKSGALITAVGACRPNWREMDDTLLQNAAIVVDSRAAAVQESGDIILSHSQERISAELGEVVRDAALASGVSFGSETLSYTPPADWPKTIVFKSLGMAVEDVISAQMVFNIIEKKKH